MLRVFLKWSNQSCTAFAEAVFPKFGVCKTLHKIQIFFAKLMFISLQNLDCTKCFFTNSRLPKSGVCQIFCKVQIFSAKPQSKCVHNGIRTKSPPTNHPGQNPSGQNPPRTKSPWTKSPQYILYFIDSNILY